MPRLPKSIIQKYGITKKAWSVYRGTKRSRNPLRRVKRTLAKRRVRRSFRSRFQRSRKSHTFPLTMLPAVAVPLTRIIAGDGAHLMGIANAVKTGDMGIVAKEAGYSVAYELIGMDYNGQWDFGIIGRNLGLIIGGMVAHKLANKSGINAYMRNIPVLGNYVSI